jgi:hypothetical protein
MEVGQGPNWGCSANEKKKQLYYATNLLEGIIFQLTIVLTREWTSSINHFLNKTQNHSKKAYLDNNGNKHLISSIFQTHEYAIIFQKTSETRSCQFQRPRGSILLRTQIW